MSYKEDIENLKPKQCPGCGAGIHQQDVKDSGFIYTVFACFSTHLTYYGFVGMPDEFLESKTCLIRQQEKRDDVFKNFYLKIKLVHPNAKIPTRATNGDAGMDVYAPLNYTILPYRDLLIPLGWKCEFPKGYAMIFKEKSGRATKDKLDIGASLVDSGYRGTVHCHLFNNSGLLVQIYEGEKIAQFIIVPCWAGLPIEVTELSESERGEGGFGSTGIK